MVFLIIVLLPSTLLVVAGWRLMRHEDAVAAQERQARREQMAEAVVTTLRHRLEPIESQLRDPNAGFTVPSGRLIERDLCSCGEVVEARLSPSTAGSDTARALGDGVAVIGMTLQGDLYFQNRITQSDIYTARLELATERAIAAAVPVAASHWLSSCRLTRPPRSSRGVC